MSSNDGKRPWDPPWDPYGPGETDPNGLEDTDCRYWLEAPQRYWDETPHNDPWEDRPFDDFPEDGAYRPPDEEESGGVPPWVEAACRGNPQRPPREIPEDGSWNEDCWASRREDPDCDYGWGDTCKKKGMFSGFLGKAALLLVLWGLFSKEGLLGSIKGLLRRFTRD